MCGGVNCGEGGCIEVDNRPKCICTDTFEEPDENGYCDRLPRQEYSRTLPNHDGKDYCMN